MNAMTTMQSPLKEVSMATLTIRKLDDSIKRCLRIQAANHGVSMEEEARRILRRAFGQGEKTDRLGARIHGHFVRVGGVDKEGIIPPRSMPRAAPFETGDK